MEEYDYYEEWMLHLKKGDILINKTTKEKRIFVEYHVPKYLINGSISPPTKGSSLFFYDQYISTIYNLNYWQLVNREAKLKRILNCGN